VSEETYEKISVEDMRQMIERNRQESRSIYAPSGSPDPRLRALFKGVSTANRNVERVSGEQTKIDVTFLIDLEPLAGSEPELIEGMTNILLHDGHRRLASGKISVEDSGYRRDPDRLVYTCAESYRSKIDKLVNAWNKP